jgi:hypothetical protein
VLILPASPPAPETPPAPAPTATPTATPRPSPTAAAATAAVTIPGGSLSARRVQRVTLVARATPGAECSIDIGYQGAPRLDPAAADRTGVVSWTWRVGAQAPLGTWPITVSCGGATAATHITVS